MTFKFAPSTRSDIDKYYRGSFIKLPKDLGELMVIIDGVNDYKVTGRVEDGRDLLIYLDEDFPYEVEYVLPHKSFFQYGDDACMLERIPARQYHRGVTSENTQIRYKNFVSSGLNELPVLPLQFETLRCFVNKQKFLKLSEALVDKRNSVVMDHRMMFVPKQKTWYIDFVAIARVKEIKKQQVVEMLRPVFREEVEAFLKSTMEQDKFLLAQ